MHFLENTLKKLFEPGPRVYRARYREKRGFLGSVFHAFASMLPADDDVVKYYTIQETGSRTNRWHIALTYERDMQDEYGNTYTVPTHVQLPESIEAWRHGLSAERILEIVQPGRFDPLHGKMQKSARHANAAKIRADAARHHAYV